MRGVSPLLVPLVGVLALGERLSVFGWLGVGSVVVGIWILGNGWRRRADIVHQAGSSAMWTAGAVGLSITLYTTLDKMALRYIPAVTLNDASNLGNWLMLSWLAIRSGGIGREWRINWRTIAVGGVISPGGYLLFLLAIHHLSLARLAPIREIGIVFGTILGIVVLKEPQGRRRMAAAGIITGGVMLLAAFG